MYSDGYKYWLAYKKNNTSYYRCSRYKTKCPGRCVVDDEIIRNTTPHNHPPEPDQILVDKFRKALTYRAATETTDLYNIFWDEAIQRHADAAMLYTYSSAESAMRKARRKQLPPVPNTIQELGNILFTSNIFKISSGTTRDQFYQTTLMLEDTTCLIFIHLKTLELIGRVEEMHIDVTFEILPSTPPNYFLLTAHSVHLYNSVPFLYSIMTAKTKVGYAAIFAYMRENYAQYISPKVIMSNFDTDIQTVLRYTFPEAIIKGFWFIYTDEILRNVKLLEMQSETARGHGASCLRMLLVLPLLPAEYMASGLEAIRKLAQDKKIYSTQMMTLFSLIEQNWFRSISADKMSIFSLPHSIYNHIQIFNKDLQNSLGVSNPMVWQMLETITTIATRTYVKVMKRSKQVGVKIQPKKGQQILDTIIKNATQQWIRTPTHLRSPIQFLQLSSHCINDTIYYASLEDIKLLKKQHQSQDISTYSMISTEQSMQFSSSFPISNQQQSKSVQRQFTQIPKYDNNCQEQAMMAKSSHPPPLAFFPKVIVQRKIMSLSEPPPLVPIGSKR